MRFEINVSKGDKYIFSTSPNSATTEKQMLELYDELTAKFPEAEGYEVEVTFIPGVSYGLSKVEVEMLRNGSYIKTEFYFKK